MTNSASYVERAGLRIDHRLAAFVDAQVLSPLGQSADGFWQGFADLLGTFAPRNRALLAKRDSLQAQIDAWHVARAGKPLDQGEYQAFLREIGYLVPEPAPFTISTQNVDAEIATMAGPQLVVPVLNARFLLNAANARWGSLYDAFYGTDAIPHDPSERGKGYNKARGDKVIAKAKAFLDAAAPLATGSATRTSGRRARTSPPQGLWGLSWPRARPFPTSINSRLNRASMARSCSTPAWPT